MIIVSDFHARRGEALLTEQIESELLLDKHKTLIVVGDVTHAAKSAEYEKITDWFYGLLEAGIKIVLCVGNHDITLPISKTSFQYKAARSRYGKLTSVISSHSIVVAKRDNFDIICRIGNDIFVALRSTHSRLFRPTRITKKQYHWAEIVINENGFTAAKGFRLHLVTHHSLWKKEHDKHRYMNKGSRIIDNFLAPFQFVTAINGHNHRFDEGYEKLKNFNIYHIQTSIMSARTKKGKQIPGFVKWEPEKPGSAVFIEVQKSG